MAVTAKSHAACNIVEVPSEGKAASFSLDYTTKVTADLVEGSSEVKVSGYDVDQQILQQLTSTFLNKFSACYGVEYSIESSIPAGAGLGELESVAAAASLALVGALARRNGSISRLKINKYLVEQFAVVNGEVVNKLDLIRDLASLGLRFDYLVCCFYGGFSVCGNETMEILRRGELEKSLKAVVCVTESAGNFDFKSFGNELSSIWDKALAGDLYTAMKMNSLLEADKKIVSGLVRTGALTVASTGNGRTLAGLTRDDSRLPGLESYLEKHGVVETHSQTSTPVEIECKPRKIYRVKDFMELNKAGDYYFL